MSMCLTCIDIDIDIMPCTLYLSKSWQKQSPVTSGQIRNARNSHQIPSNNDINNDDDDNNNNDDDDINNDDDDDNNNNNDDDDDGEKENGLPQCW